MTSITLCASTEWVRLQLHHHTFFIKVKSNTQMCNFVSAALSRTMTITVLTLMT